jgi:hypothetical protein
LDFFDLEFATFHDIYVFRWCALFVDYLVVGKLTLLKHQMQVLKLLATPSLEYMYALQERVNLCLAFEFNLQQYLHVGLPVNHDEGSVFSRCNCSSARGVLDECELAKRLTTAQLFDLDKPLYLLKGLACFSHVEIDRRLGFDQFHKLEKLLL